MPFVYRNSKRVTPHDPNFGEMHGYPQQGLSDVESESAGSHSNKNFDNFFKYYTRT
jgi:hypothetical protein